MVAVWGLGYATPRDISEHLNMHMKRLGPILANMARAGILHRRKVGTAWLYSIDNYWATTNLDAIGMRNAVEAAQSEGFDPTVRQL